MPAALAAVAAFAFPAASADLSDGESRRYVGPSNGVDPCELLDAGEFVYGGACFTGAIPDRRLLITIEDDTGDRALAHYRVYDEDGDLLSSATFCGKTHTPLLHPKAVRVSVSVYVGVFVTNCPGTAATGLSGVVTAIATER